MTLEKELKQAKDPFFWTTKNKKPDAKYQQEKLQKENNERDILQMGLHSRWVNLYLVLTDQIIHYMNILFIIDTYTSSLGSESLSLNSE